MKKPRTVRTSRPRRESARPADGLTAMWQRLATFPERLREDRRERRAKLEKEQEERDALTWAESIRRHIRELRAVLRNPPEPADPHSAAFWAWCSGELKHRALIFSDRVVELTGVAEKDLLRVTKGAAFRRDFRRGGEREVIFFKVDFEKWVKAQARRAARTRTRAA